MLRKIAKKNPYLLTLASALLWPNLAVAYEYHGYLLGGGYLVREEFSEAISGITSNDRALASARFSLDLNKLGQQQYQILVDVRDNHDFFDKVDTERLELRGRNTLRFRQLSLRDPGVQHGYFWSIGRFLPASNNVIFNDGAEIGYKIGLHHKVGVFSGYRPQINDEPAATFGSIFYQVGAYHVYEHEGQTWDEGKYVTNMILSGPQYFTDTPTITNTWINQSLLHFGPSHRASSYLNVSGQNSPKLEEGRIEWDERLTTKLSARLSASQLDLRAYRHQQEILEPLPASAYRQLRALVQHRLTELARFEASYTYGQRLIDRLNKQEFTLGGSLTRFASQHAQAYAHLGWRRGFISRDYLASVSANYFTSSWLGDLSLKITRQNRDNGVVLNQVVIASNLGFYLSKQLIAAVGGELAADENNRIASGIMTIGYRFGTRELTPLRDVAPPNTRY